MRARWATFDCYGTLVDWNSAFEDALRPLFGTSTSNAIRAYHRFERQLEEERPHRLYKDVLSTGLSRVAESMDFRLPKGKAERLQRAWATMPVFADVELMLAELRAMGFRLAVLTNCDNDLFEETQKTFRYPFDEVVTAEQVGAYKPSLSHFQQFAKRTGVRPGEWVHVACSWYHDIVPAKTMGIPRFWLDRDRSGHDPGVSTARVLSGHEVCPAIRDFLSRPQ